jgi:hypothetical protein
MAETSSPSTPSGEACRACNDTASLLFGKSWFTADGFYRTPCWFCNHAGKQVFNPPQDLVEFQRRARAA